MHAVSTPRSAIVAKKQARNYRFSEECLALVEELSQALGVPRTQVYEQAIRKLYDSEEPRLKAWKRKNRGKPADPA